MRKITRLNFFFSVLVLFCSGVGVVSAQCPTVTIPHQSFCDIQASTIANLVATDGGNGVVWYPSDVGTTPLPSTTLLVNNTFYYADDNSGACGSRQSVYVTVLSAPTGPDFQTSCVESVANATIGNSLALTGYYVQWYENETGGTPLPLTTQITGGTIYYASQMNPFTGCETSRKAVFVDVVLIAPPTGTPIQYFCNDPSNPSPTLASVDVDTAAPSVVWYPSSTSFTPLPITTPLVNGVTYYAASYNAPCISGTRLAVTVILSDLNQAGNSNPLSICDYDLSGIGTTLNLFDNLGGTPSATGVWTGSIATTNGHLGTVDLSLLTYDVLYTFTYSVTDSAVCPEATASIDIIIISSKNPGQDGVTLPICPTSTDLVDLFAELGGSPDVGGTWSPALASGTNIFDPALDSFGVYTYSFNDGCSDTSTVTVTELPVFDAGDDNTTQPICPTSTVLVDLFAELGGTPDAGGIWTPALASGTGMFDPTQDAFGVYTYSFTDSCSTDTATVTVVMLNVLDPGISDPGVLVCEGNTDLIDLFGELGGTPDVGGTWSPALASGTNIFNPALDSFGVYTYSFNDGCSDSSTVTVTELPVFDAGDDNSTPPICPTSTALVDLFAELGGTPDAGGIWTPALASGTGVFDPTQDAFGIYTYSFTDSCSTDTATVTVVMLNVLDPGMSNPGVSVCEGNTDLIDLFGELGGTPDVGGTWSPALASGTNIFNPALDSFGVYTYSFNDGCSDTSTVTVTELPVFDAGDDNSTPPICPTDTTLYNLFDYLTGTPDVGGIWTPALVSGTGMFDPTQDAFGIYTYSFTDSCSTDTATVTVVMLNVLDPGMSNPGVSVCSGDMTLIDLFGELGGTPDVGGTWSPALASGTGMFDPSQDAFGVYTYSFNDGCSDTSTVTVTELPVFDAGDDNSTPPICPTDTTLYNLFDYLNGTPDAGGIWTPALVSGTGMFDPTQDAFGVYTYSFTDSCSTDTATVTVVMLNVLDPGISNPGVLVCEGNTDLIDLFGELGGTPDVGGTWSPALASGTGMFDPSQDAFGVYTYSFNDGCSDTSTVTVTELPVFDAGDDNSTPPICPTDTTLYNLFDYLNGTPDVGGIWTPALASGTGMFDPTQDTFGVYTYSFTDGCSTATATVTVVMDISGPSISNPDVLVCADDMALIDLFDELAGAPNPGGVWTPALASGTGVFDPAVDTFGTYVYSFGDGCISISEITIIQLPIFDAGDDGTTPPICPTSTDLVDLFALLGSSADVGGVWTPALASGTGMFDPTQDAFGIYTYSFTDSCSTDFATVTVIEQPVFDAGDDNSTPPICPTDTTLYNLFDYLNGTPDVGGIWTPSLASGTGMFDPTQDAFGVYTYSFTDGCSTDSATVTVVMDISGPSISNPDVLVCADDMALIDLFDELEGAPNPGGVWTPALASGTGVFDPAVDIFGTYVYSFGDGCISISEITIIQQPVFDAGDDNTTQPICSTSTALVDLFAELGGTPDVGGIWTPALASGTGMFDPTQDTFGVYTYSFTDSCSTDTATVTVVMLNVLDPGMSNPGVSVCEGNTDLIDLFGELGGTPDIGGTWSPALASGTGIFDPSQDAFGVYTYSFNDGCSDTSTVTVIEQPVFDAGDDNTTQPICPTLTALVDLFAELGGTPDAGGIWTPALASGTGMFDPTQDAFGVYTYSFTDSCSTDTATVTVVMLNVLNPGMSNPGVSVCEGNTDLIDLFAELGGTPDVGGTWFPALASGTGMFDPSQDAFGVYTYSFNDGCSDTATVTVIEQPVFDAGDDNTTQPICPTSTDLIDLFAELGGTPDAGGIWTPALASGTGIFDPTQDAFGVYTYSFTDGCSTDTATVTVVMLDVFDPGISNPDDVSVCSGDMNLIDLFAQLGGTPDVGGTWSPALASGTNIFNPALDSFGVYTYSFNDGCSDTATVTVTELPVFDAGDDNTTQPICPTSTALVDLFAELGGTPDVGGIWTPALASGTGMFDPTQDAFGVYTYSFTDSCSTDTATVTVVMLDVFDPGMSNPDVSVCEGNTDLIDLFGELGGTPDVGGTWSPALASGTGMFDPSQDSFGVYTYSFNDGCSDTATVTVIEQPVFDAGDDNSTPPICPTDTTLYNLFDYLTGTPDAGGVWTPALVSGTGIFDPSQDAFGVYTYSFTDSCSTDTATVTVVMLNVLDPGMSNPDVSVCEGNTDLIDLFGELGGTPDVGGTWSPALVSGTGMFDPSQDSFGVYTYSFNDGCSDSSTVTVTELPVFDAGDDNSTPPICPTDTTLYNLFDYLNGTPDVGGIWTPSLVSGTGMFDPTQDAFGVYTYSFNDCSSIAVVTVVEDENCDELFIPDGFSPNEDGINDYFEIKNIRTLYPNFKIQIYNRYGNTLFKGDASKPDWDGRATDGNIRFDGGVVPVGVYFFILEFNDGQRKPLQGRLYLSR